MHLRAPLPLLLLAALGCGTRPDTAGIDRTPVDADTGVVRAAGPLVVAAFPTTQAEIDANADAGEALSDFQYTLPGVAAGLRARGVALAVRYARPVRIAAPGRTLAWQVSADSGGVGYLLLAPGRPPHTLWGVHTDSDLLEAAADWLGS